VNLTKQNKAIEKFKHTVENLRVLEVGKSIKAGRQIFWTTLQPWQHGLIKSSNALPAQFNYIKEKYGIDSIRTKKVNQVMKFHFLTFPACF
jgi:hypothetical protein